MALFNPTVSRAVSAAAPLPRPSPTRHTRTVRGRRRLHNALVSNLNAQVQPLLHVPPSVWVRQNACPCPEKARSLLRSSTRSHMGWTPGTTARSNLCRSARSGSSPADGPGSQARPRSDGTRQWHREPSGSPAPSASRLHGSVRLRHSRSMPAHRRLRFVSSLPRSVVSQRLANVSERNVTTT